DHVIGGKNEHRGCVIASHDPTRAERDGGSGVAFRGFSYDVFFWKISKQFANGAFLFGVGQDQNAFIRNKAFKTRQRFFEQSLIGNEAQQLFGTSTPAQRPKAFAATAGEDKRVYRSGHVPKFL